MKISLLALTTNAAMMSFPDAIYSAAVYLNRAIPELPGIFPIMDELVLFKKDGLTLDYTTLFSGAETRYDALSQYNFLIKNYLPAYMDEDQKSNLTQSIYYFRDTNSTDLVVNDYCKYIYGQLYLELGSFLNLEPPSTTTTTSTTTSYSTPTPTEIHEIFERSDTVEEFLSEDIVGKYSAWMLSQAGVDLFLDNFNQTLYALEEFYFDLGIDFFASNNIVTTSVITTTSTSSVTTTTSTAVQTEVPIFEKRNFVKRGENDDKKRLLDAAAKYMDPRKPAVNGVQGTLNALSQSLPEGTGKVAKAAVVAGATLAASAIPVVGPVGEVAAPYATQKLLDAMVNTAFGPDILGIFADFQAGWIANLVSTNKETAAKIKLDLIKNFNKKDANGLPNNFNNRAYSACVAAGDNCRFSGQQFDKYFASKNGLINSIIDEVDDSLERLDSGKGDPVNIFRLDSMIQSLHDVGPFQNIEDFADPDDFLEMGEIKGFRTNGVNIHNAFQRWKNPASNNPCRARCNIARNIGSSLVDQATMRVQIIMDKMAKQPNIQFNFKNGADMVDFFSPLNLDSILTAIQNDGSIYEDIGMLISTIVMCQENAVIPGTMIAVLDNCLTILDKEGSATFKNPQLKIFKQRWKQLKVKNEKLKDKTTAGRLQGTKPLRRSTKR